MSHELMTAFLEDLAQSMDYWVDTVVKAIEDPEGAIGLVGDPGPFQRLHAVLGDHMDDLRIVLGEGMQGLLHSVLVTIDGGTASAELDDGPVRLTDINGRDLPEGLHEWFSGHLDDTGRSNR